MVGAQGTRGTRWAWKGVWMTDPRPEVSRSIAADAGAIPESGSYPSPFEAQRATGRSAGFEACVEDIRKRLGSNIPFLFPRLEDEESGELRDLPPSTT